MVGKVIDLYWNAVVGGTPALTILHRQEIVLVAWKNTNNKRQQEALSNDVYGFAVHD